MAAERIVLFDLDGVIFRGQSQRLLLNLAVHEGLIKRSHYALLFLWFLGYRLGLVRRTSLIRARACRLFRGMEVKRLEELLERHRRRFTAEIQPAALALIEKHRRLGDRIVLVSAAIEPLVSYLAALVGIDRFIGTRLAAADGRFTGEIEGKAVYGTHKRDVALQILSDRDVANSRLICYADHISDGPLLMKADRPVAVNPDRRLRRLARQRRWEIITY